MVVCAIFIILTAVVLASNSRFGNVIILQNLAHDIALSVRSAQVYGIAVRRCDPNAVTTACVSGNQFANGYGVHFAPGAGYELFVDVNDNGLWDPGETVQPTTIGGGFFIVDVCAPEGSCGRDRVDIVFRRPEPDACISANDVVTVVDSECVATIQRAHIILQSPRDDQAVVVVEGSGQISVQ